MKEVKVSLKKFLMSGLRPDAEQSRGMESLIQSVGVYPRKGSLVSPSDITFEALSTLGCSFPYPQMFVLSGMTLVCTETAIYTYSGGVLSLEIGGLTADEPWTVADFNTYLFMTNGTNTIILNPETGVFTAVLSNETPPAQCVCGTGSQIIWGGPDLTMLDIGMQNQGDSIPPTPTSFSASYATGTITANWSMLIEPADLRGYRIRISNSSGATFEQMVPAHSGYYAKGVFTASLTTTYAGHISLALVAEDVTGQQSIPIYSEVFINVLDFKALGWPGVTHDSTYSNGPVVFNHHGFVNSSGNVQNHKESMWYRWNTWNSIYADTWDDGPCLPAIEFFTSKIDLGQIMTLSASAVFHITQGLVDMVYLRHSVDGVTWTDANIKTSPASITARYIYLWIHASQFGTSTPAEIDQFVLTLT